MKNGIRKIWCFAAGILLWGTASAFAGDFTLTGVGPANLGGVYTSPYTATVDGVQGLQVICDDFSDDVWVGESWTVNETSLAALPLLGASSPVLWDTSASATQQVTDYITAAILAIQLVSLPNVNSTAGELLSYAIWDVFTPTASASLSALNISAVNSYLTAAKTQAAAVVAGASSLADATAQYANVMIYTADPKSGGAVTSCPAGKTCGAPQEFLLVKMAEPGSIVLLAVDLLAVISLICFFRRRSVSLG
jgi:hypothetical protein